MTDPITTAHAEPAVADSPRAGPSGPALLIGIAASVLVVYILSRLNVPDAISGIVAGVIPPLPSAVATAWRSRGPASPPPTRPAGLQLPAATVVGVALGALFTFRTVADTVTGYIMFAHWAGSGQLEDFVSWQLSAYVISIIPLCVGTFLLLRWAARCVGGGAAVMALGVVTFVDAFYFLWLLSTGHSLERELAIVQTITFICQLAVAVWAADSGRRSRLAAAASSLVERMPTPAQQVLLQRVASTFAGSQPQHRPRPPRPTGVSSVTAAIAVLCAVAAAMILSVADVPEPMLSTVVSGVGLLPATVAAALTKSSAAQGAEVRALLDHRSLHPRFLTVTLCALLLLVTKGLIVGLLWNATMGWVLLAEINERAGRLLLQVVQIGVGPLLYLAVAYAILRSAAIRLGPRCLRWLLLATGITGLLFAATTSGPDWWNVATAVDLALVPLLAGLAVLAAHRRERHAAVFVLYRLLRRLPPADAERVAAVLGDPITPEPSAGTQRSCPEPA